PRRPRELLVGPLVRSARSPERMRSDCDKASTDGAARRVVPAEYAISIRGGALIFRLREYPRGVPCCQRQGSLDARLYSASLPPRPSTTYHYLQFHRQQPGPSKHPLDKSG